MKTYKQVKCIVTGKIFDNLIQRFPESDYVPFDTANTDYQAYLQWLAEGNTPEPADEVTQ